MRFSYHQLVLVPNRSNHWGIFFCPMTKIRGMDRSTDSYVVEKFGVRVNYNQMSAIEIRSEVYLV